MKLGRHGGSLTARWSRRLNRPLASWLCSFALLAATPAWAAGGAAEDDIFQSTNLLHIAIEIPEQGMQQLRSSPYGFQASRTVRGRTKVKCRIIEGGRLCTNVAIQLKGNSSFQPIDGTPALTLNFGKFAPGQKFHGLAKISLNNSLQDSSFL